MHEVLHAVTNNVMGQTLPDCEMKTHIDHRMPKAFPSLVALNEKNPSEYAVSEIFAASFVQAAWRGFESRAEIVNDMAAGRLVANQNPAQRLSRQNTVQVSMNSGQV